MTLSKPFTIIMLVVVAWTLLFVDFFTKAYVQSLFPFASDESHLLLYERPIFDHFLGGIDFSITLAYNRGIAWGLFSNFSFFIIILRIIIIAALLIYLCFSKTRTEGTWPLVLIITGACGNIVDCFLYGTVIDFLRFSFWNYHFPIFNVADSLITIGVVSLVISNLLQKRRAADELSCDNPS